MGLKPYARVLWRWRWLILLVTLTMGVTAGVASLQLPKQYRTTAVGLVNPKQVIPPSTTNPNDTSQVPNIDQLVGTYVGLINTAPVRDRLVSAGIPRSADALSGEITATARPSTTLIDISVTDSDPAVALAIAQNVIPAYNASLDELQSKVLPAQKNQLDALVAWEVPRSAPGTAVSPDIPRNVFLGLMAGLVISAAAALLIENLDDSIKDDDDVVQRLGSTVLGTVIMRPMRKESGSLGAELAALSALHDPVAEQYRAMRTNVMYSRLGKPARTLVITSTAPGEGKTTTACNLAAVMAQAGNRVLLVDADFRRPNLHEVFNQSRNAGLGNLLLGDRKDSEVIHDTEIPNLRVVTTGPTPPNPSELLGSASMKALIRRLETLADVIILDSPPVGVVTDATVLGASSDGVVLVVEQGHTSVRDIKRTIATLQQVGVTLLGVVLNKVRMGSSTYYSYYGDYMSVDEDGRGPIAAVPVAAPPHRADSGARSSARSPASRSGEAGTKRTRSSSSTARRRTPARAQAVVSAAQDAAAHTNGRAAVDKPLPPAPAAHPSAPVAHPPANAPAPVGPGAPTEAAVDAPGAAAPGPADRADRQEVEPG